MVRWRRVLLVVFSVGWVLPMWDAGMTVGGETLQLLRHLVFGGQGWPSAQTGTSFPVEEFAFQTAGWEFTLACAWLVVAIVYWTLHLTRVPHATPDA